VQPVRRDLVERQDPVVAHRERLLTPALAMLALEFLEVADQRLHASIGIAL
jgi:hypothetical protein